MATLTLISRPIDGQVGNQTNSGAIFSPDGTRVAYSTSGSNLEPGSSDGRSVIVVQDLRTGEVTRVASSGADGIDNISSFAFSPDGGRLAIESSPRGGIGSTILIRDLASGLITRLAEGSDPTFSPDGTRIGYTRLVGENRNSFVKDLATGAETRLSVPLDGGFLAGDSLPPTFSPDGTKVVFYSGSDRIAPGDNNGGTSVILKDLVTGAVSLVSTRADGSQAQASETFDSFDNLTPVFSPDGRKVLFVTGSALAPDDTNSGFDLYLKDLVTGELTRVSTDANGAQANVDGFADLSNPAFSPDGTQIVFESEASNLVPNDTNGIEDVFVKDLLTGEVRRITQDANGVGADRRNNDPDPVFSPDGTKILFTSAATNLVAAGTPAATGRNVFLYELNLSPVGNADAYAAGYDAPLTVAAAAGLLRNDIDPNGDRLTAEIVSGPANGAVTLGLDGSFTYTPNGVFVGTDTFTYRAFDGERSSAPATVSLAVTGNVTRASTDRNGGEVGAGVEFDTPAFSPDGTRVAFVSSSNRLAPENSDAGFDIFVKDLATGAITSISTTGALGPQQSPTWSPDGTRLAFNVFGDDGGSRIMTKNLVTGEFATVSTNAAGQLGGGLTLLPAFSPDGTRVSFASNATNLVAGDTNGARDIFVKDLATGAISRISTAADGTQANNDSVWSIFSPDGTKIAFTSGATNLVPGATRGGLFLKDLATGAITLVSTSSGGTAGNGAADMPAFSPDGTRIAFSSDATNLVPNDTNRTPDIFVKDLVTGETVRVSVGPGGEQADDPRSAAGAQYPVWLPDGNRIAFASGARNLVPGDTNEDGDIFIKDLATGALRRVSVDAFEGQATNEIQQSSRLDVSSDGTRIAFYSFAQLEADDRNGAPDIYVKDLTRFPIGSVSADVPPFARIVADRTADGVIGLLEARAVSFTVTGLDADADAVATFTDGTRTASLPVAADGTYTVDLSGFSGAVTPRLAITDTAGNTAVVNGVPVLVDVILGSSLVGRVVDGYVAGATVFADADGDGSLDPGEASAVTGADGAFTLTDPVGRLIASGGTDVATGLPLRGALTAPAGSRVVTPLTTLVEALATAGVPDAAGRVKAALDLPATFDLLVTDPFAGTAAGDADAARVLVAGAQVQDVVALIAAGLPAGADPLAAARAAITALAGLAGGPGGLDLTRAADIAAAATAAGLGPAAADAVGRIAALTNARLEAAPGTNDPLGTIASVQTLVQGTIAGELVAAGSDPAALARLLATYVPGVVITGVSGPANVVGHAVSGTLDPDLAGALVTVRDGATTLGTTTADGGGAWSLPFVFEGEGATPILRLTASVEAGGVVSSDTLDFALDFTPNRPLFGSLASDASSPGGQVYALYAGLLERAPDTGGLVGWVEALESGASLAEVASGILASAEYTARLGPADAETDAGFVAELYATALGRAGDAEGAAFWTAALAGGLSRAEAAIGFALSPENLAQEAPAYEAGIFVPDAAAGGVARLYYALLERAPDASGLRHWTDVAREGGGLDDVAAGMIASAEYGERAGLGDAAFIDALYEGALGRDPDSEGGDAWLDRLGAGESRADIAVGIAGSVEAATVLAPRVEEGWHLS